MRPEAAKPQGENSGRGARAFQGFSQAGTPLTSGSGVHANEAESAIKLSVRPNQAPITTHTGCGCLTPRGTVVGESSGAASGETPQCAVMGECTAAGETAWQGGCCVPGTSPADQAQAASRQCLPHQQQLRPVGPNAAAQNLKHGITREFEDGEKCLSRSGQDGPRLSDLNAHRNAGSVCVQIHGNLWPQTSKEPHSCIARGCECSIKGSRRVHPS